MKSFDLLQQLVEAWLRKAAGYDRQHLFGAVDAFWTTFVAYNAVYEYAAARLSIHDPKDSEGATYILNLLDEQDVARLRTTIASSAEQARKVLEEGVFYAHSDRRTGEPDTRADTRVLEDVDNVKAAKAHCLAILKLIYQVRCNMFHGRKELTDAQVLLLNPMTDVLREVVQSAMVALARPRSP